jgi:hypothetical protein
MLQQNNNSNKEKKKILKKYVQEGASAGGQSLSAAQHAARVLQSRIVPSCHNSQTIPARVSIFYFVTFIDWWWDIRARIFSSATILLSG